MGRRRHRREFLELIEAFGEYVFGKLKARRYRLGVVGPISDRLGESLVSKKNLKRKLDLCGDVLPVTVGCKLCQQDGTYVKKGNVQHQPFTGWVRKRLSTEERDLRTERDSSAWILRKSFEVLQALPCSFHS